MVPCPPWKGVGALVPEGRGAALGAAGNCRQDESLLICQKLAISLDLEGNLKKPPLFNVTRTQNSLKLFSLWAFRQWLLYVPCDFDDSSSNPSSELLGFPLTASS